MQNGFCHGRLFRESLPTLSPPRVVFCISLRIWRSSWWDHSGFRRPKSKFPRRWTSECNFRWPRTSGRRSAVPSEKQRLTKGTHIIWLKHPHTSSGVSICKAHTYIYTSNGGCHREEKSRKHWSFFTKLLSSIPAFLNLLDQIKGSFMYWLHWKSVKKEPSQMS